ncbi:hypothetical protein FRC01_001466, partial [Tulasnella sp. 417]
MYVLDGLQWNVFAQLEKEAWGEVDESSIVVSNRWRSSVEHDDGGGIDDDEEEEEEDEENMGDMGAGATKLAIFAVCFSEKGW